MIRGRFGLGDRPVATLGEIGRSMSLTVERIRQLEKEALVRLREPMVRQRLAAFSPGDGQGDAAIGEIQRYVHRG